MEKNEKLWPNYFNVSTLLNSHVYLFLKTLVYFETASTECSSNILYKNLGLESAGDNILCAEYGNKHTESSCSGDMGAPMVCIEDEKPVLRGSVSWGFGCSNTANPGVFAKTSNFADWIQIEFKLGFKIRKNMVQAEPSFICWNGEICQESKDTNNTA